MARHPDIKTSLYITGYGILSAATATGAVDAYLGGYNHVTIASLGAASVICAGLAMSPVWYRPVYQLRRGRFQNLTDFTPFDIKETGRAAGVTSYEAKFKERIRPEFRFMPTERLPLNGPVPISTFRRMVKIGWRRQLNAEYGNGFQMMENAQGKLKQLHPNEAWSRNFLCHKRRGRERFLEDIYEDIVLILYATGFYDMKPDRLTHPGRLIEPLLGIEKTCNGAMEIWQSWYNTPSPTPRKYVGMARLVKLWS